MLSGFSCLKDRVVCWYSFSIEMNCVIMIFGLFMFVMSLWKFIDFVVCNRVIMIVVCFLMFMSGVCRWFSLMCGIFFGVKVSIVIVVKLLVVSDYISFGVWWWCFFFRWIVCMCCWFLCCR